MYNQQLSYKIINYNKGMKIKEECYINKQFESTKYGPYKITRISGKDNNGSLLVEIEFLLSGASTTTRLSRALNGSVRDPQYGINFNKIYYSDNYGPYNVLEVYKGKAKVGTKARIKFINTGNEKIVHIHHAINGDIYDNLATYKTPIDTYKLDEIYRNIKIKRFAYAIWREMCRRCNDENFDNYNYYGESGVSICDRWNDFNNFKYDIQVLPQYEKWYRYPTLYQLDKDYLQLSIPKNKRIYSSETCMFLYYIDNINLARIEKRNNYILESNYYGVHKETNNTYSSQLQINGSNIYLGTFDDEIVAANVYNYWYEYYHNYELVPLFNNVPFVPKCEFIKHNTRPKTMCTIIK